MIKRSVSPKYMYYFGLMVHLVGLVGASIILSDEIFEQIQYKQDEVNNIPIFLLGIFFIIMLLLFIRYINSHIYFYLLQDNSVYFVSLFRRDTVPIGAIRDIKYTFNNTYKLKIKGKTYFFFGFKSDVEYLKDLLE